MQLTLEELAACDEQAHEHGFRPLRSDEPLAQGVVVVTLQGELDTDPEGGERVTPPMSIGQLESLSHGDVWNLTFPFNDAWVCPTEAELRDPGQYLLYIKE